MVKGVAEEQTRHFPHYSFDLYYHTTRYNDSMKESLDTERAIIRAYTEGKLSIDATVALLGMPPADVEETARLMIAADRRESLSFEE